MSVVQVSKQLFVSMIPIVLHVQVAPCGTSTMSSSSLVFNLTALAFRTVQTGLQSSLTQINPAQGCTPQTHHFPGGRESPPHRSDAWTLKSTSKWLQVCILTNCTFHEEWNGTCFYTEITESLCFVVRRSPQNFFLSLFPHFMSNSQKCQIRAAKTQSAAGQVKKK